MSETDEQQSSQPAANRLLEIADWLDRLHIIRITAAIGFPIALIAFGVDLYFRSQERAIAAAERVAREEGRIGLAWQLLTTKARGNSGKGWAISHLVSEGRSLDYIDVSGTCGSDNFGHPVFQDLFAPCGRFNGSGFRCARMIGAVLHEAMIGNADLENVDLSFADIGNARILFTDLRQARLTGTNAERTNFTHLT